jgi:hypothetical protein
MKEKYFSLLILGLLVLPIIFSGIVSADPVLSLDGLFSTSVYQEYLKPYFLPAGAPDDGTHLLIGIISFIMIMAVMYEILMLISPLGDTANIILTICTGLLVILFGGVIQVASWVIAFGAFVFGWAGALGVFMTLMMGVAGIIFIFFGGRWLGVWIARIKTRKLEMKAIKDSGNILYLKWLAKNVGKP